MHGCCWAWLCLGVVWTILLILIYRQLRRGSSTSNAQPAIGLRVSGVWAEGVTMDPIEVPPFDVPDSMGATLQIEPGKDAGGETLPEDQYAWAVESESVVDPANASAGELALTRVDKATGASVTAAPFSRFFVNTHPGVAKVTVTHVPSGRSEIMRVRVGFTNPEALGLKGAETFPE